MPTLVRNCLLDLLQGLGHGPVATRLSYMDDGTTFQLSLSRSFTSTLSLHIALRSRKDTVYLALRQPHASIGTGKAGT